MTRHRIVCALAAALIVCSTDPLGADVRVEQKTRVEFGGMLGRMMNMFGGKAAKEGVTSTVAVKGDRKATTSGQTGQIVDLAEERIYDLDLRKKQYKITTFAEERRRLEEAQRKAADEARREGGPATEAPTGNEKQMEIDVDVRNTGERKAINGFDTRQVVITITAREKGKTLEQGGGLVATTDLWLAPTIDAMNEVRAFDMRYAQQLYGGVAGASAEQMAAAMALYPMMKEALGRMSAEGGKIDGTAIMTTMTMDAVKSAEQMAQESNAAKAAQGNADSTPSGRVGGLIGGLARRAARRNDDEVKARTTFMTSTTEVLKVAADVGAAELAVEAGFKENK